LTGDGTHCEPLTLSDVYGRYLLRCQALGRSDTDHVWPVLETTFHEFGLHSDNGPPFASTGVGCRLRSSNPGAAGACYSRQAEAKGPARLAQSALFAGGTANNPY